LGLSYPKGEIDGKYKVLRKIVKNR
jgi:hypothetical protein